MAITLISFVGVMVVLMLVHEFGHFIAAKSMGVPVVEFGLGWPPKLFGREFKGTLYSINLLPLGAFVRMTSETDPNVPGSLAAKGLGTRFLVMIAGSGMNLLLPIIVYTFIFALPQCISKSNHPFTSRNSTCKCAIFQLIIKGLVHQVTDIAGENKSNRH